MCKWFLMLVAENNRASSVSTLHRAANVLDGDDDGLEDDDDGVSGGDDGLEDDDGVSDGDDGLEDTDDDGGALLRTSGHPAYHDDVLVGDGDAIQHNSTNAPGMTIVAHCG